MENRDVSGPNTREIRPISISTQERSETQLHTVRVPETAKMLGFTRCLLDMGDMEQT